MSLALRQRKVAEAEAGLSRSSERLKHSWSGLKQQGNAALTPGRVVVGGLLSGYFSGVLTKGSTTGDERGPTDSGGYSLLLALIQLGSALLPHLLPSLAPAFRAGVAAGATGTRKPSQPAPAGDSA